MSICEYKYMEHENILTRFGNNVCAERNRLRLTQAELAEKVGISEKHLGKIERGIANPKLLTVINLIKALGVPFDTLTL